MPSDLCALRKGFLHSEYYLLNLGRYRVFLGNRQYFVSSDVGGGRMQWYAFHCEKAGGTDPEGSEYLG